MQESFGVVQAERVEDPITRSLTERSERRDPVQSLGKQLGVLDAVVADNDLLERAWLVVGGCAVGCAAPGDTDIPHDRHFDAICVGGRIDAHFPGHVCATFLGILADHDRVEWGQLCGR